MSDSFDAVRIKDDLVKWIREMFDKNGRDCYAVVGISGGKDSSVVAALCVEALGKERVIGVLMPNGKQNDIGYSYLLVKHLGISTRVVNIGNVYEDIKRAVTNSKQNISNSSVSFEVQVLSGQALINLPARIRMTVLYAISQSVGGRVMNTCNLSEDWVGYSTRYGDSAGDFSPLAMLTSDEVVAIGDACGLPDVLTHKTPSDGLCGKTDEENLGFTYEVLNKYIRTGVCEDDEIKRKIDNLHRKNLFKLQPMPHYEYGGQIYAWDPY